MDPLRLLPSLCVLSFLLLPINNAGRNAPASPPTPFSSFPSPQIQPVYFPAPAVAPSVMMQISVGGHQRNHMDRDLVLVAIVASGVVVMLFTTAICAWFCWKRRRTAADPKFNRKSGSTKTKFSSPKASADKGLVPVFEYASLESATDNFSERNILGEGGFGRVYKARLDDGVLVAVKRVEIGGQEKLSVFENEINVLGRTRHQNIVSLLGYCLHAESRFLVYELMQNGSLETQLHGPSHGSGLSWHIRLKIALDTARGLEYLHEHHNPPVIHRDIKSSNILLDSDFNAKISDFGLSVINGSPSRSPVNLSGTVGYVAPEYLLDGELTDKSDVYSFGVVLLELLIGRRPVEKIAPSQSQSVVTWAMPQLTDRSKLPTIVDPIIRDTMDLKHLYQVAAVAVLCVQPEPSYRPLITDVLHSLIPLVPLDLGGTLRVTEPTATVRPNACSS